MVLLVLSSRRTCIDDTLKQKSQEYVGSSIKSKDHDRRNTESRHRLVVTTNVAIVVVNLKRHAVASSCCAWHLCKVGLPAARSGRGLRLA